MEEVADATVILKLNRPWATFPFLLANGGGMMVNTKVADEAGESFGTNPVGAGVGPYEFASYATTDVRVRRAASYATDVDALDVTATARIVVWRCRPNSTRPASTSTSTYSRP